VRKVGKQVLSLLLLTMGIFFSIAISAQENSKKPLVFVAPDGARPYVYTDGTLTVGILADILRELGDIIDRPIEIKLMDFRKARRMVMDGEADAVMPLSLSPERQQQFDFTTPLFNLSFTVFARQNETYPADWPNMKGIRIGAFGKGMSRTLAEKWYPKATIVTVNGSAEAMRMVQQSEIDAMITTRRTGSQAIYKENIFNVAPLPITLLSTPAGFAMQKGNADLFALINPAIHQLLLDGTIDRILSDWEGTRVVLFTKQDVWVISGLTAAGISVSFFILGYFYRRQKRSASLKLQKSEERFRDFAESASDWFWETDTDGRIIWETIDAGDAAGRHFDDIKGMTREEIAGDLMPEDDWASYQLAVRQGTDIRKFEYSYLGTNGKIRYSVINGKALHDSAGHCILRLIEKAKSSCKTHSKGFLLSA
jgi:ABC-type amino acid transport substrate-binding protein